MLDTDSHNNALNWRPVYGLGAKIRTVCTFGLVTSVWAVRTKLMFFGISAYAWSALFEGSEYITIEFMGKYVLVNLDLSHFSGLEYSVVWVSIRVWHQKVVPDSQTTTNTP